MLDQLSKTRQSQSKDPETRHGLPAGAPDQHLKADVAPHQREVSLPFVPSRPGAFQNKEEVSCAYFLKSEANLRVKTGLFKKLVIIVSEEFANTYDWPENQYEVIPASRDPHRELPVGPSQRHFTVRIANSFLQITHST